MIPLTHSLSDLWKHVKNNNPSSPLDKGARINKVTIILMSIWQTESWQKMLVLSKQTEQFFVIENVYVEKRKVSLWQYGLFILWSKEFPDNTLLWELKNLCRKENCLFIQIETLSYDVHKEEKSIIKLKQGYYKKFITPYTAVINLEKSEEEILARMKPKGRYNIRLSEKKWVEILSLIHIWRCRRIRRCRSRWSPYH